MHVILVGLGSRVLNCWLLCLCVISGHMCGLDYAIINEWFDWIMNNPAISVDLIGTLLPFDIVPFCRLAGQQSVTLCSVLLIEFFDYYLFCIMWL